MTARFPRLLASLSKHFHDVKLSNEECGQPRVAMDRRHFIRVAGGAAAVFCRRATCAQEGEKIPKVGVLWHAASPEAQGSSFRSLAKGFTDLGYVEGRIIFDHRFPHDMPDRLKSMAAQLVASNLDLLIAAGDNAAAYAKAATTTIPIVFILVADPMAAKLVESLERPGGNATGISSFAAQMFSKQLQVLKEMMPQLSRVGLLVNANEPTPRPYIAATQAAAGALGLATEVSEWHSVNDLGPAFDALKRGNVQAFTMSPDGPSLTQRALIGQIALARGIPVFSWSREGLRASAVSFCAVDADVVCEHAAVYVDKILKGAKPGELPVEAATRFECRVSARNARSFGLAIPASLSGRTDIVIE
jgi:putative ABC transport system substrate-binding protein